MTITDQYTVERFLEYVRKSRAKNTLIMYREGLERFAEWYKPDIDSWQEAINEVLKERVSDWTSADLFKKKRFARKIEEFHGYLVKEKKYAESSATYYCQGIRSLFRYYEMPVKLSAEVDKRHVTTRDFVPRVDQYAEMFKVADNLRDKLILSMGLTLGWRIGDFAKIRKSDLPRLDQETPIPFEVITEKEDVLAKTFLSDEVVDLLRRYLPTLPDDNPYLFPSNGKGALDHTTFNRVVKELAEKSEINIPHKKRIRFHCFRKRFLSEAANLRIDVNLAKLMCGKSVPKSMLAYLSEANLKESFLKLSGRLRLTEKKPTTTTTTKEAMELKKEVERLKRIIHGIIALGGSEFVDKAKDMIQYTEVGTLSPERLQKGELSVIDLLEKLGEAEAEKQEKKQLEEYKRIIEENNNH